MHQFSAWFREEGDKKHTVKQSCHNLTIQLETLWYYRSAWLIELFMLQLKTSLHYLRKKKVVLKLFATFATISDSLIGLNAYAQCYK